MSLSDLTNISYFVGVLSIIYTMYLIVTSNEKGRWLNTLIGIILFLVILVNAQSFITNISSKLNPDLSQIMQGLCDNQKTKDGVCDLSIDNGNIIAKTVCPDAGWNPVEFFKSIPCNIKVTIETYAENIIAGVKFFSKNSVFGYNLGGLNSALDDKGIKSFVYIYSFALIIISYCILPFIYFGKIKNGIPISINSVFSDVIMPIIYVVFAQSFIYGLVQVFDKVLSASGYSQMVQIFSENINGIVVRGGLSWAGMLVIIYLIGYICLSVSVIAVNAELLIIIIGIPMLAALSSIYPNVINNIIGNVITIMLVPPFILIGVIASLKFWDIFGLMGIVMGIVMIVRLVRIKQWIGSMLGEFGNYSNPLAEGLRTAQGVHQFVKNNIITKDSGSATLNATNQGMKRVNGKIVNNASTIGSKISKFLK